MQFSCLKSMMPFGSCTIAPGAGHAFKQPASAQCMHWYLAISQLLTPSSTCSLNLIRFQKLGVRSGCVWYVLLNTPSVNSWSFHSWHATSHALQPMHSDVSTSFATVV